MRSLIAIGILISTYSANASVLQILHTNDLHASLNTAGAPAPGHDEFGGWPQLKATLDRLTAEAKSQSIETIRLDAGDYSEGSSSYFADQGAQVLRTFQDLNFDATALGNHDWLMGARDMDRLYGRMPFPFPVLSANIKISSELKNLRKQIVPSTQIIRGGVKVGVFGLSTNEALYRWIPNQVSSRKNDFNLQTYFDDIEEDGVYNEPTVRINVANRMIEELRGKNDVVIALTHLGLAEDKLLAAKTRGLDLIVGGHSHTILESASRIHDQDEREVQIVQAGHNGQYVGKILLEVDANKNPSVQVLSYELVPVLKNSKGDQKITDDVEKANFASQREYGPGLNDIIGESEVRLLSGDSGPTAFSQFVVDAMKDSSGTEIAFDVGAFHGNTPQAAGPVTPLKLMEMYPRRFENSERQGLAVYTAIIPGYFIKEALKFALKFGQYIPTSGIHFEVGKLPPEQFAKLKRKYHGSPSAATVTPYFPSNILINGAPLRAFRNYTMAAPESLIRGGYGISSLFKIIIRKARPTHLGIWESMVAHLRKQKVIRKLSEFEQFDQARLENGEARRLDIHRNADRIAEGEGFVVPWINDAEVLQDVIHQSITEIVRNVKPNDVPAETAP